MEQKVPMAVVMHIAAPLHWVCNDIVVAGECKVTEASQVQGEATAQ